MINDKLSDQRSDTFASVTPTILVVDDDAMIRNLIQARLQAEGFIVVPVSEGSILIDMFKHLRTENKAASIIVILDVQMPRMDGPRVLLELQSVDPELRAYFMTGDPSPYTPQMLIAFGARAVFAKPLDFKMIVDELRR